MVSVGRSVMRKRIPLYSISEGAGRMLLFLILLMSVCTGLKEAAGYLESQQALSASGGSVPGRAEQEARRHSSPHVASGAGGRLAPPDTQADRDGSGGRAGLPTPSSYLC